MKYTRRELGKLVKTPSWVNKEVLLEYIKETYCPKHALTISVYCAMKGETFHNINVLVGIVSIPWEARSFVIPINKLNKWAERKKFNLI